MTPLFTSWYCTTCEISERVKQRWAKAEAAEASTTWIGWPKELVLSVIKCQAGSLGLVKQTFHRPPKANDLCYCGEFMYEVRPAQSGKPGHFRVSCGGSSDMTISPHIWYVLPGQI